MPSTTINWCPVCEHGIPGHCDERCETRAPNGRAGHFPVSKRRRQYDRLMSLSVNLAEQGRGIAADRAAILAQKYA